MVKRLSNEISDVLASGGIIKERDKDKCSYGIDIMISSVVQIAFVFMLSIFLRNFVKTLLFFFMFIPLRIYAGGYHADTRVRCFAILISVYIAFCSFIKLGNERLYAVVTWGGMFFSMIMVWTTAPVLHSRKQLTDNEIHAFRQIAIIICCVETALILIGMLIIGQNIYILSCECGQLAVSMSMAAAYIKKYFRRCENEKAL